MRAYRSDARAVSFFGALDAVYNPSYEALAAVAALPARRNVELARVRLGEVFGLVVVQGRPRFPRASADVSRSSRSRIDGGRDFESCGWMCEQFTHPIL